MALNPDPCPCCTASKHPKSYAACCGPLHAGAGIAATPEALMRSRYSAYVLANAPYLLATWHASTRPPSLDEAELKATRWIGLAVQQAQGDTVRFVARHKVQGRAHRLQETSRFVFEDGRWFYLDGVVDDV